MVKAMVWSAVAGLPEVRKLVTRFTCDAFVRFAPNSSTEGNEVVDAEGEAIPDITTELSDIQRSSSYARPLAFFGFANNDLASRDFVTCFEGMQRTAVFFDRHI